MFHANPYRVRQSRATGPQSRRCGIFGHGLDEGMNATEKWPKATLVCDRRHTQSIMRPTVNEVAVPEVPHAAIPLVNQP
jgi:hypothetical protein